MQRPQGLEQQVLVLVLAQVLVLVRQVLEPLALVLVLVLKRLMVLRALVQLRAARALVRAALGGAFDLV